MTSRDQLGPGAFGPVRQIQTALPLTATDGTVVAPGADPCGTLDLLGLLDDEQAGGQP